MKKYKVYLFDFDNTLFDTLESSGYVFVEVCKKAGIKLSEEDILFYTRQPLQNMYKDIYPESTDEDLENFVKLIRELVNSKEANKSIKMFDDTYDTVLDLKMEEATLGIVTSNNEKHVKEVLKRFDLEFGIFDIIVGDETERAGKPSPKSLQAAMAKLPNEITPDEIVYIGDAINDVLAAKNAGIDGILLDRYNEYNNEPYTVIKSLKELL